jgi:hypothetical protein
VTGWSPSPRPTTKPPSRCPNGLGPNQVLVGHVACLGRETPDVGLSFDGTHVTPPDSQRALDLEADRSHLVP